MDCCPICQENIACKPSVKILQKGADGINNASLIRGDEIRVSAGDAVHQQCRKDYTNAKELKNIEVRFDELTQSKGLRFTDTFCWKEQCLFCCEYVKLKDKKRSADVFRVSTLDFQDKIVDICHKRNDTWGLEVLSRVSGVNDLPAADALYHQQCSVNFRTGRNMPKTASTPQDKKRFGRPKENLTQEGFLSAMEYLKENDDGQLTVQDLVGKMSETCGEEKSYSTKYMKTRIKEHFDDEVVISYGPGKPNFVTLRRKAISILEEFHKKVNTDVETEKRNIIEAAKELIKSDIKEINCSSKDEYPSSTIISSMNENVEFIPSSLYILLEGLISEKEKSLKIASLGQTIIQAARPRSIICPLQLGLGVQLHHHFGSKFLIDTLNRLGFCLSYSEVQTFELSASVAQDPDVHTLATDQSIQYVADNIDHNVRTLDGLGTFHGMGMLSGITPGI
ncbi:hypothetical protein FSP39_006288 [Pinctada imbricata]|uniref:Uncharacterized protein n=1 Tax=Pinctada imbricata TaxID=66713 RepID=A0AA88YQ44_PINIB|nr:hypothetical protein FSP39_006288 [Pinctada imbricata]